MKLLSVTTEQGHPRRNIRDGGLICDVITKSVYSLQKHTLADCTQYIISLEVRGLIYLLSNFIAKDIPEIKKEERYVTKNLMK